MMYQGVNVDGLEAYDQSRMCSSDNLREITLIVLLHFILAGISKNPDLVTTFGYSIKCFFTSHTYAA